MTKMERVKAGLRACRQVACPEECPYIGMCTDGETVEFGLTERWYQCGVCGHPVDRGDLYCRMCGAAIIWD